MMDDVDEFLRRIENKYSRQNIAPQNELEEQLLILSEEFDTLGLPTIHLNESKSNLLQQIACNASLLIQLHRKTLSQMTDLDINSKNKDTKNHDQEKTILDLKNKMNKMEHQNLKLQRSLAKLNDECAELSKIVNMHNEETEKMKRYFKSKQNELLHQINYLKNENHRLKEICSQDFGKYVSKDDKFLKILQKHKQNEEVYKNTLQKLEDNNAEIMNEILNLKAELAVAYSNKE